MEKEKIEKIKEILAKAKEEIEKIEKVEKVGVKIDEGLLGYKLTALVFLKIEKGKYSDVEIAISNFPNVVAVYGITGNYDTLVIAKFKGIEDLNYFLTSLARMNEIRETYTSIVLEKGKENFFLISV